MDQQPTDPNNPTPPATPTFTTPPVTPVPVIDPVSQPAPVTPVTPTSMWDVQPNPPVVPVSTFTPSLPSEPSTPTGSATPNFGENSVPVITPVAPVSSEVPAVPAVPSWAPANENSEAMPTDLSNLMNNTPSPPVETAQQPIVVVPPTGPEINQVVTSGSKGFPKIILILGGVLILIAIGASAYFILGIGNSSNLPVSLPVEQQTLTTPPTQIVPSIEPVQAGTGSATLGNPSGGTVSGTPVPATTSGISAIDLLKSRISPTP